MVFNRDQPAGLPSQANGRALHLKKTSELKAARFIAREEEFHQASQYAQFHKSNANRALWEEKQSRRTGNSTRSQQNKKLDEERELLNKEVLAIRQARLQEYYNASYQEWEQELRDRGLALVRDRD